AAVDGPGSSSSCGRAAPAPARLSVDDYAELLRIRGARLAAGERRGHLRHDADAGVAVFGFEDVRQMPGGGDPGGDDRFGRGQVQRAPREVLADDVAGFRIGDVAVFTGAPHRRQPAGRDVFEVVQSDHFLRVRFAG